MSSSEEQNVEATGPFDEPYVVSDERLVEIRAMLVGDGSEWPLVRPGVSREMLAGAIFDFLAERDEAASAPSPPEPASKEAFDAAYEQGYRDAADLYMAQRRA